MNRRIFLTLVALALAPFAGAQSQNQGYPFKPVTIVVPFPPGGGTDALARIMQPTLGALWKQPIIVENKPGAAGAIGGEYVAQQKADGYTLLMSSTAGITAKNVDKFAPITLVSASPYVVVVNAKVPAKDIRELVDYARRNPGKLTFGSSGTGAASHLAAELFKSMAGVDMLHVPYKGTGQAVTDLVGGQIDVMFSPAETVMQHVQAGRLRALAVTSAKRFRALPTLPTVAESGVPGYEAVGWFGLFAPKDTPPALVAKIANDAKFVLSESDVADKMLAAGRVIPRRVLEHDELPRELLQRKFHGRPPAGAREVREPGGGVRDAHEFVGRAPGARGGEVHRGHHAVSGPEPGLAHDLVGRVAHPDARHPAQRFDVLRVRGEAGDRGACGDETVHGASQIGFPPARE
jgi:tripartite-type tricarboxylate transporter receptor subunit TctC